MIVYEVFKLKHRGTIATVQDPEIIPTIGTIVYSGDDSWAIIGIEKMRTGCFSFRPDNHTTYHFLLAPIGYSQDPIPSLVLNIKGT